MATACIQLQIKNGIYQTTSYYFKNILSFDTPNNVKKTWSEVKLLSSSARVYKLERHKALLDLL